MPQLTEEGRRRLEEVAARHGVSPDAAQTLLAALQAGHGNQAQFNHPEFGGMGQWSRGGMVMVGDMFNNALKARVDALCTELAALIVDGGERFVQSQSQSQGGPPGHGVSLFVPGTNSDWPEALGVPVSVGAQNDLRYAVFPATRRLAIRQGGSVRIFDTGDHRIAGVGQQQSGSQSVTFTSQHGTVRLDDLQEVGAPARPAPPPEAPAPATERPAVPADATPPSGPAEPDVFAKLERLADFRDRGILSEEEFAAKKAELLARL